MRSLGYDLPMVEEGEPDPEFESILDTVDPNRYVGGTFYFPTAKQGIGILRRAGCKVCHVESCIRFRGGEAVVFTTVHVKVFVKIKLTLVKKKFTLK